MFKKLVNFLGGDPNKKEVDRLAARAEEINALEPAYEKLTNEQLQAKTAEFKNRLAQGETLDSLLHEAFAAVREASKRTIGLRPYDVQLIGGMVLDNKTIAEMRTGEGKTLVATLPAYLNALTGRGVHIVTVNDYLARRDARWMAPIYNFLGISVGVLQMAARTENGRKAFVVNLENTSPIEDQHQLDLVDRKDAYLADIVYGTNSEFGFDYLRDNLTNRLEDRSQRGHYYAIVDEVDNILIDEARTPLIISGPASDDTELYLKLANVVRALAPEDYEVSERDRTVTMTEVGQMHVEDMLQMSLGDPARPEDINPEQARILGHLEQALKAQFLYHKNKDYLVQAGKVVIVDEFTGRLMPGRRWSEGLHQAVEAKENVKVEAENITYATITIQNYFRMYEKLAGMTGTALTEAEEFDKIYKLQVLPIPTNLEYNAIRPNPTLTEVSNKDTDGYRYTYYSHIDDSGQKPVFWRRKDYPDVIYRTIETKLRAITQEILHYHIVGRPLLVGTTSVEHSELLSSRLQTEGVRRLSQAMLIRDAYLTKHNKQDSETSIPELKFLYNPVDKLNVAELRQFARSVDMNSVNPEDAENLPRLLKLLSLSPQDAPRLEAVLRGGIPHEVLNARKHDTESQIIAGAGAFGAVTIATNMAGRGVDIKLGGELDEEVLNAVSRVLRKPGVDPYEMTNQQKREALRAMNPEDYELYAEQVQAFLTYMDNMDKVRQLGGLHVIGSERHEARRIDNQLRGRAARQGDPGSSRFYLSLEDDLMRLFGGQQAEGLLSRFNIEESLPIENAMVAKLVEQSQTRVEGSNFDVRKHLLEYDDVLNMQRKRIYEQRDRVFTKADLSEDVNEMLEIEVKNRVDASANDTDGYWKLLSYLEEIQPPIPLEEETYPTYPTVLLTDEIRKNAGAQPTPESLRKSLLDLAFNSLEAERDYLRESVSTMLESASSSIDTAYSEREDFLDTFFQGLPDRLEQEGNIRPQQLADELSTGLRIPVRLSNEDLRKLAAADDDLLPKLKESVRNVLKGLTLNRAIGAMQRRLPDLSIDMSQLQDKDWASISDELFLQTDTYLKNRTQELSAAAGPIDKDLQNAIEKNPDLLNLDPQSVTKLLQVMAEGTRLSFDRKTHQRGQVKYQRLATVFYATKLLEHSDPQQLIDSIAEHLKGAQASQRKLFGRFEIYRLSASNITFGQLLPQLQDQLRPLLGNGDSDLNTRPIAELSADDKAKIEGPLGTRLQNEIYRDVLLSSISNLWVEHLTKVDALRVSIGLEAYAQRDPLVMYKGKATEMFHDLLNDIRSAVVSRILTYQPVRRSQVAEAVQEAPVPAEAEQSSSQRTAAVSAGQPSSGKKRKRHRK